MRKLSELEMQQQEDELFRRIEAECGAKRSQEEMARVERERKARKAATCRKLEKLLLTGIIIGGLFGLIMVGQMVGMIPTLAAIGINIALYTILIFRTGWVIRETWGCAA